jgi:hypothetical protein
MRAASLPCYHSARRLLDFIEGLGIQLLSRLVAQLPGLMRSAAFSSREWPEADTGERMENHGWDDNLWD